MKPEIQWRTHNLKYYVIDGALTFSGCPTVSSAGGQIKRLSLI